MSLVEDKIVPRFAFEDMGITTCKGVRGDTDVECMAIVPAHSKLLASFRVPVVAENPKARQELLELHLPVENDASRNNNQMRPPNSPVACEVGKKGNGLDSFAIRRVSVF